MSENVKIVPATCSQCGGTVEVDPNSESAKCPFCGTTFIVEKAINNYNVQHATIEHADNVNIDMSGTVKTVLDFVGDQMNEDRKMRKEMKKHSKNMFKIFGFMFGGMLIFSLIAFLILRFTDIGADIDYVYSEDDVVSCYITEDGSLSVNITDPGENEWYPDEGNTTGTLITRNSDFDGYHFTYGASAESGSGYACVAEYTPTGIDAVSVCIVEFIIEDSKITQIVNVSHITDMTDFF